MGLVILTFDLETGMRVAYKVGNLPSKIGHANSFKLVPIEFRKPLCGFLFAFHCNYGRIFNRL